MKTVIMTGQLKPNVRGSGRLFTVLKIDDRYYHCILISQYDGKIVVENAEPLESHEVFIWLENHKDW